MKRLKLTATSHTTIPNDQWETGFDAIETLDNAISEGIISDDSELSGDLSVPTANPDAVERVNAQFPDLIRTNDNFIQFDDKEVAKVINNKSGKNLPLSVSDARSITSLSTWFAENRDIKSFKALSQFTGITSLAFKSFYNCTNLEYLVLPPNVTTLANIPGSNYGYFGGCSNLKVLDLNNVTNIGGFAFSNETTPTNIGSLIIRKPITCDTAFYYSKLRIDKVLVPDIITLLSCSFRNAQMPFYFGASLCLLSDPSTPITSITVPLSVTAIKDYAFSHFKSLTSINLGNVVSVGIGAFVACASLVIDTLPTSLTTIGSSAFQGTTIRCTQLPATLTSVGQSAFQETKFPELTEIPDEFPLNATYVFRSANMPKLILKVPDKYTNLGNAFWLSQTLYFHSNKLTAKQGAMNSNDMSPAIFIAGKHISEWGEMFRCILGDKAYIVEHGHTATLQNPNGDYSAREFVDIPSTVTLASNFKLGYSHGDLKNLVMRKSDATWTTSGYCKRMFTYAGYTGTHNAATVMCLIGGSEWVAYMKELNSLYSGYRFNRCSNPTSTGYTSTYDNQFHPWSDEWADYDIFGVDRPS